MKKMYVAVVTSPGGGVDVYGPWGDRDAVCDWIDTKTVDWVVEEELAEPGHAIAMDPDDRLEMLVDAGWDAFATNLIPTPATLDREFGND